MRDKKCPKYGGDTANIPPTKKQVDDLLSTDIIEKTADKIISSGDLAYPLNKKFEAFCKDYNLEYDFESKNGYYGNWLTNQAFVIYKFSDMETRKL